MRLPRRLFRLSVPVQLLLSVTCFTLFFVTLFSVFMLKTYNPPYKEGGIVARVSHDHHPLSQLVHTLRTTYNNTSSTSPSSSSASSTASSTVSFVHSVTPSTHSNSTVVKPLPGWPHGSFCEEFLSNNFPLHKSVCSTDRIICSGTPHDNKMGSCVMKRVAIDIRAFHTVMKTKRDSVETSNSLWLLHDEKDVSPCGHYDFKDIEKYMQGGDYVKRLAKTSIFSLPQSQCKEWVNGTTFLFVGFDVHIYFKFLSWFSLYNGIANDELFGTHQPPRLIIRLPETKFSFHFPEFERSLFSEATVVGLGDLAVGNVGTLCFERIVTTPWAFSTNVFRCKMADAIIRLRKKCYNCNSRGLPGTRFSLFRKKVLKACSLQDGDPYTGKTPRKIVILLRKPYPRFQGDEPTKISRILQNSEELVNALKAVFPSSNVTTMHGEDMALCDQISLIHEADVLMGVHGAGLVHLWWLQDHALLFELVPRSQLSNPTFKMLSTLTGRRYYSYTNVKGGDKKVTVNEKDVIKHLKAEY